MSKIHSTGKDIPCPYCSKGIKKTWKKCTHCNKWLPHTINYKGMMKCPDCSEIVKETDHKCNHCNNWLPGSLSYIRAKGDDIKWMFWTVVLFATIPAIIFYFTFNYFHVKVFWGYVNLVSYLI